MVKETQDWIPLFEKRDESKIAGQKPTEEQEAVIECHLRPGQSMKVESGAGTGKTFCFIGMAKRKPKSKFLYICFNNKAMTEAREKFKRAGCINTTVSTIHGLARKKKEIFEKAGKFQTKLTVKDIEKACGERGNAAWRILETLKIFCESGDEQLQLSHMPEVKGEKEKPLPLLEKIKTVWEKMQDLQDPTPISYDHYLKMWALEGAPLHYDYILLDEAQDSNPITLAILQKQRAWTRIILIGDSNQGIYSWRGAKNAMKSWKADTEKSLTESFRFGPSIANAANTILKEFIGEGKLMKGHRSHDSIGPIDPSKKFTLIARTNGTLFEKALEHAHSGTSFHFVGTSREDGWNPTKPYKFNDALDVYELWRGRKDKVKNPHIKAFENYIELKETASGDKESRKGDTELESLCKIVEAHKHDLPGKIEKIVSQCSGPEKAQTLLVTAHRAKGLEWEQVKLGEDFAPLVIYKKPEDPEDTPHTRLAKLVELGGETEREELNLIYVAITRSISRLEPNAKLKDLYRNKHLLQEGASLPKMVEQSAKPSGVPLKSYCQIDPYLR